MTKTIQVDATGSHSVNGVFGLREVVTFNHEPTIIEIKDAGDVGTQYPQGSTYHFDPQNWQAQNETGEDVGKWLLSGVYIFLALFCGVVVWEVARMLVR